MLKGLAAGAVIGATISLSALAWSAQGAAQGREATYQQLELFAEILARVEAEYVTEIDESDAINEAIRGMLASLDPHSTYLDPEAFADMQVTASGEYGGLGIEVTMEDGVLTVVSPIDDTPAERAGVEAGDKIIAIDGELVTVATTTEAVKIMRGAVGAPIVLTLAREGADEPFDVTIVRDIIRPPAATYRLVEPDVGYIRVAAFNERTSESLDKAIRSLKREGGSAMRAVILDLRNNPGGLLDQAVAVTDAFLDGGEVVSTRGRGENDIDRYNSRGGDALDGLPMAVLINGGSASAAEIVAGALQDHRRAMVVGMTSFGKGSVQSVIPLGGQRGALRLTTSKYYTPSGRSIQTTGIEPDYEVSSVRLTEEDLRLMRLRRTEANLPNALENDAGAERAAPHLPFDQPPEDYAGEDYQLERTVQLLRERGFAGAQVASRG